MFRKRFLILGILVFSIAVLSQVKSYTMASVENEAVMSITSSENSLIAMPENIETKVYKIITNTITKTLTDAGELQQIETNITAQSADGNFSITNNMNEDINVSILMLDKDNEITLDKNQDIVIFPGETWDELSFNYENSIENKVDELLISAKWDGGSAEIYKDLNIVVQESNYENINTINLCTPIENNSSTLDSTNSVDASNTINKEESQTDFNENNNPINDSLEKQELINNIPINDESGETINDEIKSNDENHDNSNYEVNEIEKSNDVVN